MKSIFENKNSVKTPLFIGHRGFTPVAPENSLPSFEAAGKRGFWAIETDVHKTADGVLVCCHNASMKKMYGVDTVIEESTLSEILKLRLCRGNGLSDYPSDELRIPLFSEYIDICEKYGAVPFIESKAMIAEDILDYVKKRDMIDFSVFSSVTFDHIKAAAECSDRVFLHHIFSNKECAEWLSERGNAGLSYNYPDLDLLPDGLIEWTHGIGVKVCLRAGDTVETCHRMLELGLDYIPTNKIYSLD